MSKERTVNQHYVPRCYLENFGTVYKKGRKKRTLVAFFQFSDNCGFYRKNVSTESICYKEYYYDEDNTIERMLAEHEKNWSIVLRNLSGAQSYVLDEQGEKTLKEFALYQFIRTPAILHFERNAIFDFVNVCFSDAEYADMKAKKLMTPAHLLDGIDDFLSAIKDLRISIIKFSTNAKLITSDMPILMMNAFCNDTVGLATVGTVILFPVDAYTLALIYDSKVYSLSPYMVMNSEADVDNLNLYQLLSAKERIIRGSPSGAGSTT